MNVKRDDYRGLLNEISIAADKNFTEIQTLSLIDTMQSLGWQGSYRITVGVRRTGNLPKNVYGHVLCLLEDEIDFVRKKNLQKDTWEVKDEDCGTPEEFQLTMRCIGMLCRFDGSRELLEKFHDFLDKAIKRGVLVQELKRAEEFYSDQIKKGLNLKQFANEQFL